MFKIFLFTFYRNLTKKNVDVFKGHDCNYSQYNLNWRGCKTYKKNVGNAEKSVEITPESNKNASKFIDII